MLRFIFQKRTGFILLFILLCALGVVLLFRLPVQLYPRTNRPRVRTSINHPGYSPVDFAKEYADTIESQLLAIEGVDILEVQYGSDQSNFSMTFDWDVDAEEAKAEVESAMNSIKNQLPQDFRDDYRVRFFSGENAGYLMVGITSEQGSPEDIYKTLKTAVEPKLNQVQDVEVIEIFNIEDLEITITLNQIALLSYGLTIEDVDSALRAGHLPESIGSLEEGDTDYSVRYTRGIKTLFEVGEIPITRRGNVEVRLQDVADIDIRYDIPRQTFIMDGRRGVQIIATPIDGGNIKVMSEEVIRVLEAGCDEGVLPGDSTITTYLDPGEYIDRSISSVVKAALLGAALAMLVVLLALGEFKNTLLIGISLPVTLILSFILMYTVDVSLNLISLGGMALAVGMVVDSSIVVMENIHRIRIAERPVRDAEHLKDIITKAVGQVRSPVIASILTSILVFLPIPFTAPLTNAILGDQAKVVIFALVFSMLVALTLVPLVAFVVNRREAKKNALRGEGTPTNGNSRELHYGETLTGLKRLSVPVIDRLVRGYMRLLSRLLSRRFAPIVMLAAVFAVFLFSVFVVLPLIPKEIISPPSSDRLVVFMRRATPIESEEIIEEVLPRMEQRIQEEVGEYVESTYAEVRGFFNRFFVLLKDTRDADYVTGELQRLFVTDNTWYYNILKWDPAQLPLPRTLDLQINVQGEDEAEKVKILEQVRDIINEMELYGWVFTNPSTGFTDELLLSARNETLGAIPGYSENSLISLIRRVLRGTGSVEFDYEGSSIGTSAQYPDVLVEGRHNLENFLLPHNQSTVPLKHFFDFQEAQSVSEIVSENGEPIYRVYAAMPPGTAAVKRDEFETQVQTTLGEKLDLPAGYSLVYENPQAEMDDAIRSLFIALGVSVALIYLLLSFQFNSLKVPLVILVTIPLGILGLIFSLFVFNSTLSLNSLLGAILLSGIVVNNAIIMIDFYLQSLKITPPRSKQERLDALIEIAGIRFTPIIITTLTTVLGMLPIAIGMGEGSNIIKPLGIAVSGGLFISTLLTLFVVPSILRLISIEPKE